MNKGEHADDDYQDINNLEIMHYQDNRELDELNKKDSEEEEEEDEQADNFGDDCRNEPTEQSNTA